MANLTERYGTLVFSESVMREYLPKDVWKRLFATIEGVVKFERVGRRQKQVSVYAVEAK